MVTQKLAEAYEFLATLPHLGPPTFHYKTAQFLGCAAGLYAHIFPFPSHIILRAKQLWQLLIWTQNGYTKPELLVTKHWCTKTQPVLPHRDRNPAFTDSLVLLIMLEINGERMKKLWKSDMSNAISDVWLWLVELWEQFYFLTNRG